MGRTLRLMERACLGVLICADLCFSFSLRALGPVLVLLANGLISLVVYMYLCVLVPRYMIPMLGLAPTSLVVAFGIFLLVNIMFNYWSCVLTPPGCPAKYLPALDDLEEGTDFQDYGDGWRTCRKCKAGKPPRTHHCSVCRRCVMKMDHHCPWVNNCVGFYNYRYFCLFLVYLAVGCLYTCCSCVLPIMSSSHLRHDQVSPSARAPQIGPLIRPTDTGCAAHVLWLPMLCSQLMLFVFILCISILFALSLFLVWHAYLVATNQTTIEFYSNRMDASDAKRRSAASRKRERPRASAQFVLCRAARGSPHEHRHTSFAVALATKIVDLAALDAFCDHRGELWVNPYSLGARGNFEQVFGMTRNMFTWLLLSRKPPPGDGMSFPLNPLLDCELREV